MTTQTQMKSGTGFDFSSFTLLHWVAMILAAITGAVHIYMGIDSNDMLLLLAGLGFYGALGLMMINFRRRLLYLVGIPYTLAQMGGWVVAGMPYFEIGVVDKVVQTMIIVLLVYLYMNDRGRMGRMEETDRTMMTETEATPTGR